MKKCLGIIIDTALVIPPNTGVTYRLYYLSREIVKHGFDVKIFICNRNYKSKAELKSLADDSGIEFHLIPEAVFYDVGKMTEIISDSAIDLIQFEDQNTLLYFEQLSVSLRLPVCLEMHDVEATLKQYFKFQDSEVKMTNRLTVKAGDAAELVIAMTPFDRKELLRTGIKRKKMELIPNPIDLAEFDYCGPDISKNNIIFIGNMHYWPNRKAAEYIIDQMYPAVSKEINDVSFFLIGMAPDDLIGQAKKHKQIHFTGSVKDLNKYLKLGTICLCPITEGSGMKIKILNYAAAGLPVITTRLGMSGYEKISRLIVVDQLADFSNRIIELLHSKDKLVEIGLQNRSDVKKHYDISACAATLICHYRRTIAHGFNGRKFAAITGIPAPLWLKEKRVKANSQAARYMVCKGVSKIIY